MRHLTESQFESNEATIPTTTSEFRATTTIQSVPLVVVAAATAIIAHRSVLQLLDKRCNLRDW